jgi:hypothetical protein
MAEDPAMKAALEEIKAMRLSPTDTLNLQIMLGLQKFIRTADTSGVNTPFVDWSLTDMCRAMKIQVDQ